MPRVAVTKKPKNGGVFGCTSYLELLRWIRYELKGEHFDDVAKHLGYKSKASLSMFLGGQRPITRRGLAALSDYLSWSDLQRRHVETIILKHVRPHASEKVVVTHPKFSKTKVDAQLSLDPGQFSILSKWYRLPLFFLLSAHKRFPGFDNLYRKLRGKVSQEDLMSSVYALEQLGFLIRNGEKLKTAIDPYLSFSSKTPNQDIREFHGAMLQRASEAVVEQDIDERQLRAVVFSMDRKRLAEARRVIDEFTATFNEHFGSQTSKEICQLNVQLFWHTDSTV